jgi:cell division protein FtsL
VFGRRRPVRAPERALVRHAGARRRQRQASIAGLLAAIATAAGLAFFYLSQSSHVAAVGYEIDALQAQISALKAEQQRLVLAIGQAHAPTQVLQHATTDLHLQPIAAPDVAFVRKPTPATSGAPTSSSSPAVSASSPDTTH